MNEADYKAGWQDAWDECSARAEIARLTNSCISWEKNFEKDQAYISSLQAEIARLTTALERLPTSATDTGIGIDAHSTERAELRKLASDRSVLHWPELLQLLDDYDQLLRDYGQTAADLVERSRQLEEAELARVPEEDYASLAAMLRVDLQLSDDADVPAIYAAFANSRRVPDVTVNEAYRAGQEDMRRRIERMWRGWVTRSLHSDVPLRIRQACKVRDLPLVPPAEEKP